MSDNIIKVFISYAHESDEFRESVKQLAIWLNTYGKSRIVVTTDHIHQNRAPAKGWQNWMMDQLEDSEIVLVICTPKYYTRFRKQEEANKGLGAIFEGAIITSELYQNQLNNEKFQPIIPDGGVIDDVPMILRPFFNYLSFPKTYDRILQCILNENPTLQAINLENEIVSEIIIENTQSEKVMVPSIHMLVRHFLSLSDFEKIVIAKKLNIFSDDLKTMHPDQRDKAIFKSVKEKEILRNLWEEINSLYPFDIENPFNQKI